MGGRNRDVVSCFFEKDDVTLAWVTQQTLRGGTQLWTTNPKFALCANETDSSRE